MVRLRLIPLAYTCYYELVDITNLYLLLRVGAVMQEVPKMLIVKSSTHSNCVDLFTYCR